MKTRIIYLLLIGMAFGACTPSAEQKKENTMENNFKITKTEEEWKKTLTPQQFEVLREKGTDRPFTGKFEDHWDKGIYTCVACGNELFRSNTKFDAGCGWPSFYDALDSSKVTTRVDNTHGMKRIEIMCAGCGGHLGHIFDDGPRPTGQRYCVNSTSIDFKKE